MRRVFMFVAVFSIFASGFRSAQQPASAGPYKVIKTVKADGKGGFDYVYADSADRKLYIPRLGPSGKISVFNLDTLELAGEIPNASGHGAAVDPKSHHGFGSSKPVVMWDSKSLETIKTIDVQGGPDGIMEDSGRVYVFSHRAPNATVIDAKDGTVVGTVDLGGPLNRLCRMTRDGSSSTWKTRAALPCWTRSPSRLPLPMTFPERVELALGLPWISRTAFSLLPAATLRPW